MKSRARTRLRKITTPSLIALLSFVASAPAARASFSAPAQPSATYSSATLGSATSVAVPSCPSTGSTATATVTWTASTSGFTTGYTVSWTGGASGSTTVTDSPATISGLSKNRAYTFTVTATFQNWTSTPASVATNLC